MISSRWQEIVATAPHEATEGHGAPRADLRRSVRIEDPKKRWVDGTPEYSLHVFELRQLFPRSRFIHIVRDVAAVVRSLLNLSTLVGYKLVHTEQDAYEYWRRTVEACLEAERAFGSSVVLRIRHADLVQDPEGTLRKCLDFTGERFHPDCLAPLRLNMNSSDVPLNFDPSDPRTDSELKGQSGQLSEQLLREVSQDYPGSSALVSKLEESFIERAQFVAWAPDELLRREARL